MRILYYCNNCRKLSLIDASKAQKTCANCSSKDLINLNASDQLYLALSKKELDLLDHNLDHADHAIAIIKQFKDNKTINKEMVSIEKAAKEISAVKIMTIDPDVEYVYKGFVQAGGFDKTNTDLFNELKENAYDLDADLIIGFREEIAVYPNENKYKLYQRYYGTAVKLKKGVTEKVWGLLQKFGA